MTAPTITALPPAPERADGSVTFVADANAFVAALPTMVTQINASADYIEEKAAEATTAATVAVYALTGAANTLALTHQNGVVEVSHTSASALTIPPNASVAFAIGSFIEVHQTGVGTVTITPGSGVTLQSYGSLLALGGQYAVAGLRKVATNTWRVTGNLV